jgi:hypothetical protein
MRSTLRDEERAELVAGPRTSRNVRQGRRSHAVLLRADGVPRATVAHPLGDTQASVCTWTHAWREQGPRGGAEGAHLGAERRLAASADGVLQALLEAAHPHAHGYGYAATTRSAPLVRTAWATPGWDASERTPRRTRQRRGDRWQRPQFVRGRPAPACAEHKSPRRASGSHGGGRRAGGVWR